MYLNGGVSGGGGSGTLSSTVVGMHALKECRNMHVKGLIRLIISE